MKKHLLPGLIGFGLTILAVVVAGFGGGACHCNTPLQVVFPYDAMLGLNQDHGLLDYVLFGLQFPIYAISVMVPRDPARRVGVLLIIAVVHVLAVCIALRVTD